ncbi:NADP/FAD dependent oxidoreductase [Usnea florida]
MPHPRCNHHTCLAESSTCHPNDPIPQEPISIPNQLRNPVTEPLSDSASSKSIEYISGSENESPGTPATDPQLDEAVDQHKADGTFVIPPTTSRRRRASTVLISQSPEIVRRILSPVRGAETKEIEKVCCGGGCCFLNRLEEDPASKSTCPIVVPDNDAFRTLCLRLGPLSLDSELTNTVDLPAEIISFEKVSTEITPDQSKAQKHPPKFVTPHPPYEVYSAKVHHARELTKPGAEKRTYHFDLDVTDYPAESGDVDFVVGGAVGIQAPNSDDLVDEIFDLLGIPGYARDMPVLMKTSTGRWPTIWGDEKPRELVTTRRELLTWCSDVQSYAPTKPLLRLLAEYATCPDEKKILLYLSSAQGQAAFCDLRTGPHITIAQLLNAFPSSDPPLPHLLSVLNTLMPRFYSLSQDPQISCTRAGTNCRRLIEIAVTVHENANWRGGPRTGVGSGFLERIAKKVQEGEKHGVKAIDLDLRVPMFRGLMANPLAREFVTDGPMLLIGAGVGVAPFRGFVQRRLKSANCANKVWVLQGVRDSLLDELYSGEWGVEEEKVKKVVQSRSGEGRYVQEEVRHQADLVWFIINALDGRVFVCGSSRGMGEGVERALVDVAMDKGNLRQEEAEEFWAKKKDGGQYIAETW